MDLDEALDHAVRGQAVLFLGAGFSVAAENLRGQPIPTARQFAAQLADAVGLPRDTPLPQSAEAYESQYGIDQLLKEIRENFTIRRIASHQLIFVGPNWRRIYTTNYDDVVEYGLAQAGKAFLALTLSNDTSELSPSHAHCIHLHGFVRTATRANLLEEFRLTESSYLASVFCDSPWANQFRYDLEVARAVLFVGYSVSDIDIARILWPLQSLKEKIFFVLGNTPDTVTKKRANHFGIVVPGDAQQLASRLEAALRSCTAPAALPPREYCVSVARAPSRYREPIDRDIFELVLHGSYKLECAVASLAAGKPYLIERQCIPKILDGFRQGTRVAVLHSDLGNGKSMALEGLKLRARQIGYNPFCLTRRGETLLEELEAALRSPQAMLIVDNYPDWFNGLERCRAVSSGSAGLVLTARSSIHDVVVDRLAAVLEGEGISEIPLDVLTDPELESICDFFDHYGLWGRRAARRREAKVEYLKKECGAEWRGILLKLFEAPHIAARMDELVQGIRESREFHDILIAILALAVLNLTPSLYDMAALCGHTVFRREFSRHPTVREFFDFDREEVRVRSSVASQFMLRRFDPNALLRVLVRLARECDRRRNVSGYFECLYRELMRFSNLQLVAAGLQGAAASQLALSYYENLKTLPGCQRHPLFWLQYAIACTVYCMFDRAERYFDTAYAYAERIGSYDAFQIDNHYARFLLLRAVEIGSSSDAMGAFRKARQIIFEQVQRERLHYPYRVATLIADFYQKFAGQLKADDREEVLRAAKFILNRIERLPEERQQQKYVRECYRKLGRIMT